MNFPIKKALFVVFMLTIHLSFILSCSDDEESSDGWQTISRSNTYTGPGSEVYLVDTEGDVHLTYSLNLGSFIKNVYFIFTNTTFNNATTAVKLLNLYEAHSTENRSYDVYPPVARNSIFLNTTLNPSTIAQRGTPEITEFNHKPIPIPTRNVQNVFQSLAPLTPRFDTVGNTTTFYDDRGNSISATCRQVIQKNTNNGIPVTVNIWVADNCWNGCSKQYCINQTMVDALANKFIQSGQNNDIYEWTTAIFGSEWESYASQRYSNLIADTDEITIFLLDISNDNSPNGGVVGFFYSRDNFIKDSSDPILKYSNERIMFYLDAVMFANGDNQWEITDYWPSEIVSTLAHEFQHMIHFYQKTVLRSNGLPTEIWIDELCSLVTEDILAYYMQVDGPRGVSYSTATAGSPYNEKGRLPEYNYNNDISLTIWNNSTANYAIAYAFGAYLVRNFGGATFLRNIVQNSFTDYQAIEYALTLNGINLDFATVLRKWAASNLLSDTLIPPAGYYQYNRGDWFISSISNIEYKLGSINLYNYRFGTLIGPYIYTQLPTNTQQKISNLYYLAGTNKTGELRYKIDLPKEIKLTVVVK